MGCDCCRYSNYGETKCTASKGVRIFLCGVEDERKDKYKNSKYTKPKKRRKKK